MALSVFAGQFQITTGVATSTVPVTGVGFTPKIVLFSWCGRTANGQAEGDHKFGFGAMTGLSSRGGATSQSDHSPTTMAADSQVFDDACIKMLTIAGAVDGAADFSAFGADGFTVIIDDAFVADYTINYLAIGGADLTNVAVKAFVKTVASGTGNSDYTGIGFQPDAAILLGPDVGNVNATGTWSTFSIGVAAGAGTPNTAVLCGASQDAIGTSVSMSYCRAGETIAMLGADSVDNRGTLTAWLSDGFRINWAEIANDHDFVAICFKGGQFAVGDILSQTGTSNTNETGLAFQPTGMLLGSHCNTQSTSDTTQAGDQRSIGFAVDATHRNYVSIHDKDAAANADIGVAQGSDAMYGNQDASATVVIEGLMDLVSMNSDGFTFVMDDADPAQTFVWYLAMGDNAGGGGASIVPILDSFRRRLG